MPQRPVSSSATSYHYPHSRSWLVRKIRSIQSSRREQKQFQQLVIFISAVMIAFMLGFYFLGPNFS